jgi:NAD(P)-dependent dehydrogenase (short-subunit alcohol dehydrogenase family)
VLVACPPAPTDRFGRAILEGCVALGARARRCEPDAADEQAVDRAVAQARDAGAGIDLLAVDGAGLFAQAPPGAALRACLDATWNVTRAAANLALLPGGAGGRIAYLAPPPDAGEHAQAARAGLENLARTLSVEWARHGIAVVALALGAHTEPAQAAAICAYLASPAGAYFSGCVLDLGGAGG